MFYPWIFHFLVSFNKKEHDLLFSLFLAPRHDEADCFMLMFTYNINPIYILGGMAPNTMVC